MPDVIRTPDANHDVEQIMGYIASDNPLAALTWLDKLDSVFRLLSTQPEIGQRRRTARFGALRRHVHGNYAIYYRPVSSGVEILRVLHAARDQERLV